MSIKPGQSLVSFSGTASAAVYCDEISVEVLYTNFDRLSFTNERLKAAPADDGSLPIITTNLAGSPLQIATICNNVGVRPLGPNSVAQLENAKQKMTITRYTLSAKASLTTGINSLLDVAVTHTHLLSLFDFQNYLENQANISYSELLTQQGGNYNYLTASGLNMVGNALLGTISNVLIRSIKAPVDYEFQEVPSGALVLMGLEIVADQVAISSQFS
jgi:hypothetical protein